MSGANLFIVQDQIEKMRAGKDVKQEEIFNARDYIKEQREKYPGVNENFFKEWENLLATKKQGLDADKAKVQESTNKELEQVKPEKESPKDSSTNPPQPETPHEVDAILQKMQDELNKLDEKGMSFEEWKKGFESVLALDAKKYPVERQLLLDGYVHYFSLRNATCYFDANQTLKIAPNDNRLSVADATKYEEYLHNMLASQQVTRREMERALLFNATNGGNFLSTGFDEKGNKIGTFTAEPQIQSLLKTYGLEGKQLNPEQILKNQNIPPRDRGLLASYAGNAFHAQDSFEDFATAAQKQGKKLLFQAQRDPRIASFIEQQTGINVNQDEPLMSNNTKSVLYILSIFLGLLFGGWKGGFGAILLGALAIAGGETKMFDTLKIKTIVGKDNAVLFENEKYAPDDLKKYVEKLVQDHSDKLPNGIQASRVREITMTLSRGPQAFYDTPIEKLKDAVAGKNGASMDKLFEQYPIFLQDGEKKVEGRDMMKVLGAQSSANTLFFLMSIYPNAKTIGDLFPKKGPYNAPPANPEASSETKPEAEKLTFEQKVTKITEKLGSDFEKNPEKAIWTKKTDPKFTVFVTPDGVVHIADAEGKVEKTDHALFTDAEKSAYDSVAAIMAMGIVAAAATTGAATPSGVPAVPANQATSTPRAHNEQQQGWKTIATYRDGAYHMLGANGKIQKFEYAQLPESVRKAVEKAGEEREKLELHMTVIQALVSSKKINESQVSAILAELESGKITPAQFMEGIRKALPAWGKESNTLAGLLAVIDSNKTAKAQIYRIIAKDLDQYNLISDKIASEIFAKQNLSSELEALIKNGWSYDSLSISNGLKKKMKERNQEILSEIAKQDEMITKIANDQKTHGDKREIGEIKTAVRTAMEDTAKARMYVMERSIELISEGKVPKTEMTELFRDIEGIGWDTIADRRVPMIKMIAEEAAWTVAAIAAGFVTAELGGVGAAGIMSLRVARGGATALKIAEYAQKGSIAYRIARGAGLGAAFYGGFEGVNSYRAGENLYSMRGLTEAMLFGVAFEGLQGLHKILKIAPKPTESMGAWMKQGFTLKGATRFTVDAAVLGVGGGVIHMVADGGQWTNEALLEGVKMAIIARAIGFAGKHMELRITRNNRGEPELQTSSSSSTPESQPSTPRTTPEPVSSSPSTIKPSVLKKATLENTNGEYIVKDSAGAEVFRTPTQSRANDKINELNKLYQKEFDKLPNYIVEKVEGTERFRVRHKDNTNTRDEFPTEEAAKSHAEKLNTGVIRYALNTTSETLKLKPIAEFFGKDGLPTYMRKIPLIGESPAKFYEGFLGAVKQEAVLKWLGKQGKNLIIPDSKGKLVLVGALDASLAYTMYPNGFPKGSDGNIDWLQVTKDLGWEHVKNMFFLNIFGKMGGLLMNIALDNSYHWSTAKDAWTGIASLFNSSQK